MDSDSCSDLGLPRVANLYDADVDVASGGEFDAGVDDEPLGLRGVVTPSAGSAAASDVDADEDDDGEGLGPRGLQGHAVQLRAADGGVHAGGPHVDAQLVAVVVPPQWLSYEEWVVPQADLHKDMLAVRVAPPSRHTLTVEKLGSVFSHTLGPTPQPTAGIGAEACMLDMDHGSFSDMVTEIAATTFECQHDDV